MAGAPSGKGIMAKGNQPLGQNQFKVVPVPQRKPNKFMSGAELLKKGMKKLKKRK